MVTVTGIATTGYTPPITALDLPRPTDGVRRSHQPWCTDCKRKHDATDLDTDGRCPRCAGVAVRRADAEARRAERAAEIAALEAKHQAAAGAAPRPAPTPRPTKPPTEEKQGKPTTRSSAPRATSASSTTGRAPVAGPSTTEKKTPAGAPAGDAPRQAPAEAPTRLHNPMPARELDAQIEHAAAVLRGAATNPHPLVRAARKSAIAALETLHLAHELHQTPAAAPPSSAAAGPHPSGAPSPAPEAPPSAAGTGKGKPTRQPATPRRRRPTVDLDEPAIVQAYLAGETAPTIARRYGVQPNRIRNLLFAHRVQLRDDRSGHSGSRPRTFDQHTIAVITRRYVDNLEAIATIADDLGHHRRIITRVLTDAGVTIRPGAHLTGTVLTDEQKATIATRYAAGESMADLADEHHVRRQTIRQIVTDAGHPIRPKGNSTSNRHALDEIGATAAEVRAWARSAGHDIPATGLVPRHAIEAYATAHPHHPSTTNPAGATA
jgi:hypothetical protein